MTEHTKSMAKVSIGMPVYNGSAYIRRALDSLLSQSFEDFELIISDNVSTDDTRDICQEYERNDPRVRYIRQKKNLGPIRNFDFVLNQSKGEYFKGAAFYDVFLESAVNRVSYMLYNGYGNMFYSLFKRERLFLEEESVLSRFSQVSLNELPFFITIAFQGNWKIVPDIYFYKETTPPTYTQARWEMIGGRLPFGGIRHFISGILYGGKYHFLTIIDVFRAIVSLNVAPLARMKLCLQSLSCLSGHFLLCLLHYKKATLPGMRKQDDA